MRHRHKKLIELKTGPKTRSNFVRNLLTSLVKYGHITTTPKRGKVIKAEADSFFAKLVQMYDRYNDEKDAKREAIRLVSSTIFDKEAGKKVIDTWLPKYREAANKTGFVSDYKVGLRKGDASVKVMLKLN